MKSRIPLCAAAALLAGCGGDTTVAWKLCTDFGGTQTTNCDGTVVVIVHDAEEPAISKFEVTVRRLELLSDGRAYTFFEGARREDLLQFTEGGFLLGRRDDVPEVEFDAIRIDLTDLAVSPVSGDGYRIGKSPIEARIQPPLSVGRSASNLRIDIDVRASLAGAGPSGSIVPVVLAAGNEPGASLAVSHGRVARVDRDGGFVFEDSPGDGAYRVIPGNDPGMSLENLVPGAEVVLEGGAIRGVEIQPRRITIVP
jgi:hypothetical protein